PEKVSNFLIRHKNAGVIGATAAAVGTPLCSCGTTAVVLGMMASYIPWAPIVAFMVASPLSSPEELIYSAGLFGWPFALTYFLASIVLGLAGGVLASFFENQGWLKNQNRMNSFNSIRESTAAAPAIFRPEPFFKPQSMAFETVQTCCSNEVVERQAGIPVMIPTTSTNTCDCGNPQTVGKTIDQTESSSCDCDQKVITTENTPVTLQKFFLEVFSTGKQLLVMFLGFAFIGFYLNGLIPEAWISTLFGSGNSFGVPLAATLGLPFYISSEGSLPLISSLIDGGMNQGAAMAFLITGAGTSLGAITGALTIARWRVIALVIGTLWVGAIIAGYLFNLIITMR
ncbi:MAG TPA: permease, partial [Leptolinea sp.]